MTRTSNSTAENHVLAVIGSSAAPVDVATSHRS